MCFDERGVIGYGFVAEEYFGNGLRECTVVVDRWVNVLKILESSFGYFSN